MELPPTNTLFSPIRDALYTNPEPTSGRPWSKDAYYFKKVRIASAALVKMVTHARSGGSIEVMGLMQGYVIDDSVIVTDAFRIPVEGTETRVNAQEEANEYIVQYLQLSREEDTKPSATSATSSGPGVLRPENIVGWYHSHPGYGCWLSGIDVATQQMHQTFNDPFVAVVIDPDRTVKSGRVDIGAFRTFPENHKPEEHAGASSSSLGGGGWDGGNNGTSGGGDGGARAVPAAKVEDFGAHASKYYPLKVEHFRSSLDSKLLDVLWNKYWGQTLAHNPLLTNREHATAQMEDAASSVRSAVSAVNRGRTNSVPIALGGTTGQDVAFERILNDLDMIKVKEKAGLTALEVKAAIYGDGDGAPAAAEEKNEGA